MQLSQTTLHPRPPRPRKPLRTIEATISASHAVSEIIAYIAIRDDLLAEAEKIRSLAKIDSLAVANDFVMTCLKPARHPYEAQSLPEAEASRQRDRCHEVKSRIAELRRHITAKTDRPLS